MGPSETQLIALETFDAGTVARFRLDALLDPTPVEVIGRQLEAALDASDPPNLVLAFDGVTIVGSVMLSVLIVLQERAAQRGGRVVLAELPKVIRELIDLSHLQDHFPGFATVEEALADLG